MSKRDGQSRPAARAATLDRAHRHPEGLGGVSDGETLYVDQHDGCPLVDGQLTEGPLDGDAEFTFGDPIVRIGRLECLLLA